ncbi:hypothetical protein [Sporosarcina psychrophila]|uniref:Antirestriction protein n=1 Tax=Sporosarcina psychrophila TaxID=1476 RepID=A0ABV2KBM1_SPOPS
MTKRLTTEQYEAIFKRASYEQLAKDHGEATMNYRAIEAQKAEIERLREEVITQAERAIAAENALAEIEDLIERPCKTQAQSDATLWKIRKKVEAIRNDREN